MISSMTGYGSAVYDGEEFSVSVMIKSLNSKGLDISMRTSSIIADKEIEIRNLISKSLVRGKVYASIEVKPKSEETLKKALNRELFDAYYKEIKGLNNQLEENTDVLRLVLGLPEVYTSREEKLFEEQSWGTIKKTIEEALGYCSDFRLTEGKALEAHLLNCVEKIKKVISEIGELDPKRIENVRKRMDNQLKSVKEDLKIDQNRFEQEMIYYLEKLDISEEKVRLSKHIDHFLETLHSKEAIGKKLSFITQEMGREMNTIGAKANDAAIQKNVVLMKDELEKIKEQTSNIL